MYIADFAVCITLAMQNLFRAAKKAVIATGIWAVTMFIPGLNIFGLIAVMLPLWVIHDSGVGGLGSPNNGFFVPTELGYVIGGLIMWLGWFLLFLVFQSPAKKGGNG